MKAYITIKFKQPVVREAVDLGSLRLRHSSGRSYTLDVNQSWSGNDIYTIEARAVEDFEAFPRDLDDEPYDLEIEDITSSAATLFVDSEDNNEVESITYNITDNWGNQYAANLIAEQE